MVGVDYLVSEIYLRYSLQFNLDYSRQKLWQLNLVTDLWRHISRIHKISIALFYINSYSTSHTMLQLHTFSWQKQQIEHMEAHSLDCSAHVL